MKGLNALLISLVLFHAGVAQAATRQVLTAEEWAVPRSAEYLINMPALRQSIQALQIRPGNRLLIHYPGGDEGALWLSELRSWLISLGVPSQSIESIPGSAVDQIELEVISPISNQSKPDSKESR